MLVNIFLNSSAENVRLLQRLFRLRVRTGGDRQHRHQQRVHQRTAEQLSIRLACRQGAEHHFKQAVQISKILAGREYIARIIRHECVFAQTGHMQPADGNAVAADLHIRTGNLVVHHACVVYEQITRLDDDFFIVNQVFT